MEAIDKSFRNCNVISWQKGDNAKKSRAGAEKKKRASIMKHGADASLKPLMVAKENDQGKRALMKEFKFPGNMRDIQVDLYAVAMYQIGRLLDMLSRSKPSWG